MTVAMMTTTVTVVLMMMGSQDKWVSKASKKANLREVRRGQLINSRWEVQETSWDSRISICRCTFERWKMGLKMKAWLLSLTLASTGSYLEQTQKPFPYVDCSPVCGGSLARKKRWFWSNVLCHLTRVLDFETVIKVPTLQGGRRD